MENPRVVQPRIIRSHLMSQLCPSDQELHYEIMGEYNPILGSIISSPGKKSRRPFDREGGLRSEQQVRKSCPGEWEYWGYCHLSE